MALQIVAYSGFALQSGNGGEILQVPDGKPLAVTPNTFTGTYTVPAGCRLIKISGTGTITWAGVTNAEDFSAVEFRGVRPGETFTVA